MIGTRLYTRNQKLLKVKRGFTLIEVLTVILIIGILTTITSYTYNSSLSRSRDSQRLTDLKSIQNTLEQYYLDKRSYPDLALPASPTSYPWVAKFQLERFQNGSWPCNSVTANKEYLAPQYISTIPEDPLKKLSLSDCTIQGTPMGSGQYIYVPLANVQGENHIHSEPVVGGYYLMARMERANNVVQNLSTVRAAVQPYTFSRLFMDLPSSNQGNPGGAWPRLNLYYCSIDGGNPTRTQCDINYFLGNKDR